MPIRMKRLRRNEKIAVVICLLASLGIAGELHVAASRGPSVEQQRATEIQAGLDARRAELGERERRARKARMQRPGTYSRARYELQHAFYDDIIELDRGGGTLTLGLKASAGIFPKTLMRADAREAFRRVFKVARYSPTEMLVQFHGPLVDKATGEESDGIWSVYALTRREATNIRWANAGEIDWDVYRTMIRGDL